MFFICVHMSLINSINSDFMVFPWLQLLWFWGVNEEDSYCEIANEGGF